MKTIVVSAIVSTIVSLFVATGTAWVYTATHDYKAILAKEALDLSKSATISGYETYVKYCQENPDKLRCRVVSK